MRFKTLLILTASLLSSVFYLSSAALAQSVVGAPAPKFSVRDISGKEFSSDSLRGKIVVLEWFNPNCPFIKKFYKNGEMQKWQRDLTTEGVVWLTISSSAQGKNGHLTAETAEETKQELGINSTGLILDQDGAVGRAFGARTTPHIFIINAAGNLAYAGAVDSEPSTDPSDIATATNYIINSVRALKEGKSIEPSTTEPYGCSVKYGD